MKENPGATPRLIADALGISLNQVRSALNKLRDAGYVIRIPGEGYYVRYRSSDIEIEESNDYLRIVNSDRAGPVMEIRDIINQLTNRVDRLEKEVKEIKLILEALIKASTDSKSRISHSQEASEDRLIKEVKSRKVMKISDALAIASKPIDEYVSAGTIKVVSDLVVDPDFYSNFLGKFPIKKSDILSLSDEERTLMNAMIREGIIYLHGGREYRILQRARS